MAQHASPGAEVKIAVKRKGGGQIETLAATLSNLPGSLPGVPGAIIDKMPKGEASFKQALAPLETNKPKAKEPKAKEPKAAEQKLPEPETGLLEKNTPDGEGKYFLWVYPEYDPNIAHSVLVWLHQPGINSKEQLDSWADLWDIPYCRKNRIIIVMPVHKEEGWQPTHSDLVVASVRETMKAYTVDNRTS